MKLICIMMAFLVLAEVTSAKIVEKEITPATVENYKWSVVVAENEHATTFTISITFARDSLPEWTSVALEVFDGKKLIARSEPQLKFKDGKANCQFTVSNDFLVDSRFALTKLDYPHPSGDIYWVNLNKFAQKTVEQAAPSNR